MFLKQKMMKKNKKKTWLEDDKNSINFFFVQFLLSARANKVGGRKLFQLHAYIIPKFSNMNLLTTKYILCSMN